MSLLRLDKLVEDVTGLGKVGIGQLRNIEYGKNYLWEVSFKGSSYPPPRPFEDFFPAIDIDIDGAILENYTYEQYMSTYEVPHKTGIKGITLTFNDDDENTLYRYFNDWMNIDILNHGYFISALQDDHPIVSDKSPTENGLDSFGQRRIVYPIRTISVALLNAARNKTYIRSYDVIPKGTLKLSRDQNSSATAYTMGFTIVREGGAKHSDKTTFVDSLRQTAVEFIGRFI